MPIGPTRKGAGQLRHRVELQSATVVTDALGGRTQTWSAYATTWAAIDQQPMVQGTEDPQLLTLITIRYRTGVEHKQRVVEADGTTYAVIAVQNPEKLNRDLVLHCMEIDV
jgi:SPP1 family predicted phage head-tail adaptor